MKRVIIYGCLLFLPAICISQVSDFLIQNKSGLYRIGISLDGETIISSPEEGLWSVATAWYDGWPDNWQHTSPTACERSGEWQIVSGELILPQGIWKIRDAYRFEKRLVKCIRRFEWTGTQLLDSVTLSIRFNVKGEELQAVLPGILYYGNPSGYKNSPDCVPHYFGKPGEAAIFEEHRFPMPFTCLESEGEKNYGAVIHTLPSSLRDSKNPDHWWSMGVKANKGYSELTLLSGPVIYNDKKSMVKGLQCDYLDYGNTFISVKPGEVIEKTFYLDVYPVKTRGTAFQKPVYDAINLYKPFYTEDLPSFTDIIRSKYRLAASRWVEGDDYAGFNMFPRMDKPEIVFGWCGQAASPGYSLQVLKKQLNNEDGDIGRMIRKSLDFLSSFPVDKDGFPVRYKVESKTFSQYDPVSEGQGMYNMAKAIETARKTGEYNTAKWETFLKKACDTVSAKILENGWSPRSTAEGFYIAPLSLASVLFHKSIYKDAVIKAADYYGARHLDMKEPYWGGTLDANCEDKEGAWAAFQGFLHVYELTNDKKYLRWAQHACDVCLTYTVVWDIPLPPGRLADYQFKSRGWSVVSPQNQHIDAYGVVFSPEVYKMGIITGNEDLKRLAKVMFLSCGQLIDPYGSQGEQLQHTNYPFNDNRSDKSWLRGGYLEYWTVFWITAHFLNAAAKFQEMGVFVNQE